MARINVTDFGMRMHLNMGSKGHSYLYAGKLNSPGHPLHEQEITKAMRTEKEKGKVSTTIVWTIGKDGKEFSTLNDLIKHYEIPEVLVPADSPVDNNENKEG
jgi:hypothetical protein